MTINNCKGTLYKIGGKYYCVGEKMIKKRNGKTVNLVTSKKNKSKKNKSKKNKSKKNKSKKNKSKKNYR
jgi:hypothetical protein